MGCQTGKPQCLVKILDLHPIMVLILDHGKPQAPVGNMCGTSMHGNVVDMPAHGNVRGAWEFY